MCNHKTCKLAKLTATVAVLFDDPTEAAAALMLTARGLATAEEVRVKAKQFVEEAVAELATLSADHAATEPQEGGEDLFAGPIDIPEGAPVH